jgi:hypothetical protein
MSAIHQTGIAAQAALAYWSCQVLGWGFNSFAQTYGAASSIAVPLGTAATEILLLNALALVLSHLLRGVIQRQQWHTFALSGLLPRMVLSSVVLGLPVAVAMYFMAVAPMWSGPIEDFEQLPAIIRWLAEVQPERLFIRDGSRCWFVPLREVRLMVAEGNYVRLHWGDARPLLARPLSSLEERLDPQRYFRANRRQIINLEFIENVELGTGGLLHVQLRGGPEVEISRRQARLFRTQMSV